MGKKNSDEDLYYQDKKITNQAILLTHRTQKIGNRTIHYLTIGEKEVEVQTNAVHKNNQLYMLDDDELPIKDPIILATHRKEIKGTKIHHFVTINDKEIEVKTYSQIKWNREKAKKQSASNPGVTKHIDRAKVKKRKNSNTSLDPIECISEEIDNHVHMKTMRVTPSERRIPVTKLTIKISAEIFSKLKSQYKPENFSKMGIELGKSKRGKQSITITLNLWENTKKNPSWWIANEDESVLALLQDLFHKIQENKVDDINDWIQNYKPYLNAISPKLGMTALHHAAIHSSLEVITLLLSEGADIKMTDKKGLTPYQMATLNPRPEDEFFKFICLLLDPVENSSHLTTDPTHVELPQNQTYDDELNKTQIIELEQQELFRNSATDLPGVLLESFSLFSNERPPDSQPNQIAPIPRNEETHGELNNKIYTGFNGCIYSEEQILKKKYDRKYELPGEILVQDPTSLTNYITLAKLRRRLVPNKSVGLSQGAPKPKFNGN